MLIYPQMLLSESAGASDYPAINPAHALAAGLLWMADFTQFQKDSAQHIISGGTVSLGAGIPLDYSNELSVPTVPLNSIYQSGFTIIVHLIPQGWQSNGELIEVEDDNGAPVLLMRRDFSDTEVYAAWPSNVYYGADSAGVIGTSTVPTQIAISLDANGIFNVYKDGAHVTQKNRPAPTDGFSMATQIKLGLGVQGIFRQAYIYNRVLSLEEILSLYTAPAQMLLATAPPPQDDYPILNTSNAIGAAILWAAAPQLFAKDSNGNSPSISGASFTGNGVEDPDLTAYVQWPWPLGDLSEITSPQEFTIYYVGNLTNLGSGTAGILSLVNGSTPVLELRTENAADIGILYPGNTQRNSSFNHSPGQITIAITVNAANASSGVAYYFNGESRGYDPTTPIGNGTITGVQLGVDVAGTHQFMFLARRILTLAEITSLYADPYQVISNAS